MASGEYGKGKEDLLEDNRTDSGIESFKSITKETGRDPTQCSESRDKCVSISEERLDSAYGSSSLTVESLSEIVEGSSSLTVESLSEIVEGSSSLTVESLSEIVEGFNICKSEEHESDQEENLLTTLTEDGDTILHLAVIHEDEYFSHQLIQLFPKDVLDIQNNLYQTALHLATYLGLPSVVQGLVGKGAGLELQDQEGNTPLHVACQQGRAHCAAHMIRDASPSKLAPVLETHNWRGLSCLHLATLNRQHRLIKLLLKKGADINIQEGTSGKTALHLAVELHDAHSVSLLLSKGANVDAAMFNGCTPLHLAVGRQDTAIANLLCRSGADQMLRNMEDDTALDLADGNDDILALFPFDDVQISGRSVVGGQF